ncbi:hypothetical protein MRX96_030048 [Rhipicephalus microplus]
MYDAPTYPGGAQLKRMAPYYVDQQERPGISEHRARGINKACRCGRRGPRETREKRTGGKGGGERRKEEKKAGEISPEPKGYSGARWRTCVVAAKQQQLVKRRLRGIAPL